MSVPSRIYKVLLEPRSIFNRNFSSELGNLKLRLNSIRSNVFIKIHGNFWVNRFRMKPFPSNVKNIQAGPNNFQDCFDFISGAGRPTWNNHIQSGFISIRSGPLVVQPRYNMIPFESNNVQLLKLLKFIFRTGNKIQVLHSVFNARSGRHKRQSIRNYKKRQKEKHNDNSESKQMKYVQLLILCIMFFCIVFLLIKWNVTNHYSLLTIFAMLYGLSGTSTSQKLMSLIMYK